MKQAKTLNDRELKRVFAVIKAGKHADRNKLAFMLSFYAGLRVKEIASLTIGDVYNDDGTVKNTVFLAAEKTKGKHSRAITLNTKLIKALTQRYTASAKPSMPLIRSQKGKHFTPNSLCQLFLRIYKESAIDAASSHSGRRTFITTLAHKGVSAKALMTLAGHKHLSTTQRYIDVNDEMLKEAVELV